MPHARTIAPALITLALALCMPLAGSGCATTPIPVPEGAARAYDDGEYDRAYRLAASEAVRTAGARRDAAALIAGLSAHARGDDELAIGWLEPLVDHRRRDIAGRAAAGLGLVYAGRAEHERASGLLAKAAAKLTGEDAARANFHAGESFAAIGRIEAARVHYRIAKATSGDLDLRRLADSRLASATGSYTVQLGAFSSRSNATARAADVRRRAAALGLESPRIVERTGPDGSTLYLVHLGRFDTEDDARSARFRFGENAVVTDLTD